MMTLYLKKILLKISKLKFENILFYYYYLKISIKNLINYK